MNAARTVQFMTRGRRQRAFTLVEVAVVAAVSALLLILLLRWVTGLIGTSSSNLDVGSVQRDILFANQQLESDFGAARGCDPYGLDVPVRDIDRERIDLYVPGEAGRVDTVSWRYSDGSLQRAVTTGDGCTYDVTNPDWRTISTSVDIPASGSVFVGHQGGRTVDYGNPDLYPPGSGDCTGMNAERCLFDSIEVAYVARTPGADRAPFATTDTYPLNLTTSRLSN